MNDYYVYVYIDPRNFEEFYYGKGKGSRKEAHLDDSTDSLKVKRINAIKKEGLKPIIRVIARNLNEQEALLIEKTLLWKLGKWTTNIATGHFADKFRPHDTIHKELSGFDYRNSIYHYNVGEGIHRNWDDYRKYGFISAGQGPRWRDAMSGFQVGDLLFAYLNGRGYVGVGKVLERAKRINEIVIMGKHLLELPLKCRNMADNCDDSQKSEYVVLVDWIKAVPREQAKKYRPQLRQVKVSLDNQTQRVQNLEAQFKVKIEHYLTS